MSGAGPIVFGEQLRVRVRPPEPGRLQMGAPPRPRVTVVPVAGPRGPKGEPGGDPAEHHQLEPADVWVVDHGLGRRPVAWSLYDQDDQLRDEYIVEHPTQNRAVVRMDVPTAGTIRMI